jgi:hypothetical protein
MYSDRDVLEDFAAEVVPEHLRAQAKKVPMVGGLDLSGVLSSPYFFA